MSKELTGAAPPEEPPSMAWNADAARLLRLVCGLDGEQLGRALAWWKKLRTRGEEKGIGDQEIAAAIRGLPRVMRVDYPWEPYRLFCKKNSSLWLEAMSAGLKAAEREPQSVDAAMKAWHRRMGA